MATRFIDGQTKLDAANLNGLDRGGNVFQSAIGGLKIDVTACRFAKHDPWAVVTYAGATQVAVTANQTNFVYLDTSGVLQISTSAFPGAAHVPLAEVVCDATGITSIVDRRFLAFLP